MTTSPQLTAIKANQQIKALKAEIQDLLPKGGDLKTSSDGTAKPLAIAVQCGDPNSTASNAPTQYGYFYEVRGVPQHQYPAIADEIFKHFTASGWTIDERKTTAPISWGLRSRKQYLLSAVISPKGDLLSITLNTPCVPKSTQTFTP